MRLEGDRTIVIARAFDASARSVFDAMTKPELVARWWAPRSHGTIDSCKADVRAGGSYRYVMKTTRGDEVAFSGTYREVTPPSRLVYTSRFEGAPGGGESVVTATFEERGGKTYVVMQEVYPSAAVRDAVIASGMEHGMRESLEQLAAVVQR
ncbi:MAG: SRPBCC family protein [Acidobacteriota bacterium]